MNGTEMKLGELEAKVEHLHEDVGDMRKDIKALLAHMNKNKGGLMILGSLSAVSATVGGLLAKFLPGA